MLQNWKYLELFLLTIVHGAAEVRLKRTFLIAVKFTLIGHRDSWLDEKRMPIFVAGIMVTKTLIGPQEINVILHRLACQLVENHADFNNTVLIGLQPRGIPLLHRLQQILKSEYDIRGIEIGLLDTTFYRDDFRRRDTPLQANQTQIDFLVEGKSVVFIDDVLFTGRSIRAALDAILSFGRPLEIELMVLIDRRFSRELPIQPDYVGRQVDSIASERVRVDWDDEGEESKVSIIQTAGDE